MIKYKFNIIQALEDKGWTTYTLAREKLLSGSTLHRMKSGEEPVNKTILESLCYIFDCQPGDLIEYIPD